MAIEECARHETAFLEHAALATQAARANPNPVPNPNPNPDPNPPPTPTPTPDLELLPIEEDAVGEDAVLQRAEACQLQLLERLARVGAEWR